MLRSLSTADRLWCRVCWPAAQPWRTSLSASSMRISERRAAHEASLISGMSTLQKFAIREWLLEIFKHLWPAYLLASFLILCGFHWSLPNAYQDKSFQADEN